MSLFPSNITTGAAAIGSGVLTAAVVGLMAFGLHSCNVKQIETDHKKELADQRKSLVGDCANDKSITKGADDGLQDDYTHIDGLVSVRLHDDAQSPACVPVAGQTISSDGKTATKDLPATNGRNAGISRAELYKFAADADKIRAQLLACQSFINETWKAKGQ